MALKAGLIFKCLLVLSTLDPLKHRFALACPGSRIIPLTPSTPATLSKQRCRMVTNALTNVYSTKSNIASTLLPSKQTERFISDKRPKATNISHNYNGRT